MSLIRLHFLRLIVVCWGGMLVQGCPGQQTRRGLLLLKEPVKAHAHSHLGIRCQKQKGSNKQASREADACKQTALDQVLKRFPDESKVDVVDKRRAELGRRWRSCMARRGFVCL